MTRLTTIFGQRRDRQTPEGLLYEEALDSSMVDAMQAVLQKGLGIVEGRVVRELIDSEPGSPTEYRLLAELRAARRWRNSLKVLAREKKLALMAADQKERKSA